MAAVLKKRALAEYSQEEQVKLAKKLRLVKKLKVAAQEVDLSLISKAASSYDVMQLLLQLSEALPSNADDALNAIRILLEHLHKEKEAAVRVKAIRVIGDLASRVEQDLFFAVEDLILMLKSEKSHKVIVQILETLHVFSKVLNDNKFTNRLIALSKQYLSDSNHLVMCKCLEILKQEIPVDVQSDTSTTTLKLLADYCHSHDPRVRTAALQAVVKLHERGLKADMSIYGEAIQALSDDYEGVRIAALQLLWVVGQTYAESMVPVPDSQEQIRLIDDAFAHVCNMINDISMKVRVEAALLLGSMTSVSSKFLEQTLDKKLMSNMRRKKSAHERQKENYECGEWATGQKWADDAPREAVDAESVSLITTGACGAFVHGLEDEYLEVRNAALDSLCQLASHSPTFANVSIDFLVDMFNDEIEDVRLRAIHCLTKISHLIVLREDQLDTILAVLEDFSIEMREALHEMLSCCHLSTKVCLKMCIDGLLENLKRYPQDKRSIWKCLQKLGARHPELTLPLVPELLGSHPYFDTPEPDMDDPAYISLLILVFNACCPTMIPLLEHHTIRHYSYLRDSFPHLVPNINFTNRCASPSRAETVGKNAELFLQEILGRVISAERASPSMKRRLKETAIMDLQKLAEIEPVLSAAAQFASMYIQCQLLFSQVLSNKNWCNPSLLVLQQGNAVKNAVEQILQLSFRLSHMFTGLSPTEIVAVKQMRLKAFALQLVYIVRGSNSSALALCEHLLDQVESLQKYLTNNNLQADPFTDALFRDMDQMDDPKPGTVARILQPRLQGYQSMPLHLTSIVAQAKATIYDPTGESDNPIKFTAGLVLGVNLDAEIENVEDVKTVRVKVKYPDKQTQLILPRAADFKVISPTKYRLLTTVLLSHSVWSEACHVEVGLSLDFTDMEWGNIKGYQKMPKMEENTIDLCKPATVFISPKPAKKGI